MTAKALSRDPARVSPKIAFFNANSFALNPSQLRSKSRQPHAGGLSARIHQPRGH
jgi:hypothetical protein